MGLRKWHVRENKTKMHETFGMRHPKNPMHLINPCSVLGLSRRCAWRRSCRSGGWLLGSGFWRTAGGLRGGLHFACFALDALYGLFVLLINFLLLLVHARRVIRIVTGLYRLPEVFCSN